MVRVFLYGDVAQLAEQFLHTEKVVGSDPTFTTNFNPSLVQLDRIPVYETVWLGVRISQDGPIKCPCSSEEEQRLDKA